MAKAAVKIEAIEDRKPPEEPNTPEDEGTEVASVERNEGTGGVVPKATAWTFYKRSSDPPKASRPGFKWTSWTSCTGQNPDYWMAADETDAYVRIFQDNPGADRPGDNLEGLTGEGR